MIIDLFSDMICPWCRIGKKNLQDALAQWQGEPVTVRYRAFMLDPRVAEEGEPFRERMINNKGISEAQLQTMTEHVTAAGAAVGVRFDFSQVNVYPHTALAHRLMAIAPEESRSKLFDLITEANFERGMNIGLLDVLMSLAEQAGLDAAILRARLEAGEGEESFRNDLRLARSYGISGVPNFIINEKFSINGARGPKELQRAMQWALEQPAT